MSTGMQFGLLGPLMVCCDGLVVPIQTKKQRALLAALLLNANRVVSLDELAETLWGSQPPPSARVTLQNYVKRLRQALADAGRARISTQSCGYLISVDDGELDVTQFAALRERAREFADTGSWDQAAAQLRAALSLWRGEPLADVSSELLELREAPRLAEMRLQALEARIDADLHVGHHAEVVAELRHLAYLHPLRERLHGLLMLALYRDGRQGEALATYRHARQLLIEELGAEPGPELQDLHQRVLAADAALAAHEPGQPMASGARPAVPHQLPAAVRHFAGRSRELAELTLRLDQAAADTEGTVVISAIGGTAGVGKTALAVHWAHQVAEHFPDGQLYVNLGGYAPGGPVSPSDALARFLRALGVPGPDIPADVDECAARYRSLLDGRRMLVLLDNAGSAEQVRPLLPGTPACMAVVTSRDSLAGLVARDGARRLDLDLLPLPDAIGLLRALIGGRVDADPGAAGALAAQCAQLPLALRIAAELAISRPAVHLAGLVEELADQQQRLNLLDVGGDAHTAVRGVFSWSCRHLDAATVRAFRRLSLHPGPDFDRYAAAALTGTTPGRADRLLDLLARAHLIHAAGPGRHGMHDLLRAYARELASAQDSAEERRAALTLLFDCYLHAATSAVDALFPGERDTRPRITAPDTSPPPITGVTAAREWLDTERANLVAAAAHSAAHGWPGHASRLGTVLYRYLENGGHYQDGVTVYTHGLHASRLAGDRGGQASALLHLGHDDWRLGRHREAVEHLRAALIIFREVGDRLGQARALSSLGAVDASKGRHEPAVTHHRYALAVFREVGDRFGQAQALDSLGIVLSHLGRHGQAAASQQEALTLYREIGERHGEAGVLGNIGVVKWWQGRYDDAAEHLGQALVISRELGDRRGQARTLSNLGVVEWWRGRYQESASHHCEAGSLFREIGDRSGEAEALSARDDALRAAAQPGQAPAGHDDACDPAGQAVGPLSASPHP